MATQLIVDCATGATVLAEVEPMPVAVPSSVTMRQARLALLAAGLLAGVESAIAALPSPQKEAVQIEWEYAATINRDDALVASLGAALGLTDGQVDAMFLAAAAL